VRKFFPALLFLILFIFESLFVQYLPRDIFGSQRILAPRFLMIAILFLTIYGSTKQGILYGFLFGLLFDIVFTEILGIYLFLFPLIAYLISGLMKILQVNIFTVSFASLIGTTLLEILAFEMNKLIGITSIDFSSFLSLRLIPTLILNLFFIMIAAYPLKRNFEKFSEFLRID
jgi:rod shape-determining protein MreD